jgi:hypothetical protein
VCNVIAQMPELLLKRGFEFFGVTHRFGPQEERERKERECVWDVFRVRARESRERDTLKKLKK